jgi:hypothetical protein
MAQFNISSDVWLQNGTSYLHLSVNLGTVILANRLVFFGQHKKEHAAKTPNKHGRWTEKDTAPRIRISYFFFLFFFFFSPNT